MLPLLASSAAAAEHAGALRQALDVHYHDASPRQTLDVFAPPGAVRAPVVLFVHGGTWMAGDKDFHGLYRGVGRYLAGHGLVAVLINYRLSPSVRHPEHVKDVARSFAWVRAHAAEYGGDPDRIILCGHSAGGHLVALFAADDACWHDPALPLSPADRRALRGVVGVCGVYRIPGREEFGLMAREMLPGLLSGRDGRLRVPRSWMPSLCRVGQEVNPFRLVFGDDLGVCRQASPLTHVRPGLPPFLLLGAEADLPHLPEMAREFAAALSRAGDAVEWHCIPGATHQGILFHLDDPDDPTARALLQFVARVSDDKVTR